MTDINGDLFERRLRRRLFLLLPAAALLLAWLCAPQASAQNTNGALTHDKNSVLKQDKSSTPIHNEQHVEQHVEQHIEQPDATAHIITLKETWHADKTELIARLEQQTGLTIAYSSRVLIHGDATIAAGRHTVGECLDIIFNRYATRYVSTGRKVVVALQTPHMLTLSGYCRDALTGEPLIGAHAIDTILHRATAANGYGFFSLGLPAGRVPMRISFVGYTSAESTVELTQDTVLTFNLRPRLMLETVDVRADETDEMIQTGMGSNTYSNTQMRSMPTLMGETDLTRTLLHTPGVQSGNEGYGGMSVRGGSQDQNMVYLDDAPLYNPNHMLGFFSVFNSDATSRARMIKSGFPARYGGRMSSVLDIKTINGNMDHFEGRANVGLLASSLLIQGPIAKGRSSYMFSARRTYFDLFSQQIQKDSDTNYSYLFYDLQGKLNWRLSDSDRLYASFFYGLDKLTDGTNQEDVDIEYGHTETRHITQEDNSMSRWGSMLASVRWNHLFRPNLFCNTTAWYSYYGFRNAQHNRGEINDYSSGSLSSSQSNSQSDSQSDSFLGDASYTNPGEPPTTREADISNEYRNGIYDGGLRIDAGIHPSAIDMGHLRVGAWVNYKCYQPLVSMSSAEADSAALNMRNKVSLSNWETHAYVEHTFHRRRVFATTGLHLSLLSRRHADLFTQLEPRLIVGANITRQLLLKASYSLTTQSVYQARMLSIATPSDMWLPVTGNLTPQKTAQTAVELRWRMTPGVTLSVEGYYKDMPHLLTYRNLSPYEMLTAKEWDDLATEGEGYARGLELFLQKKRGPLTGWVGYTLSKSRNKFDEVNNGEYFASDNDRLHTVQLFARYSITPKVDIAATWNYGSGAPATLSTQRYTIEGSGSTFVVPARRNAWRMPDSHQLNIGMTIRYGEERRGSELSFGVYNVYAHRNPSFIYWKQNQASANAATSYTLKEFCFIAFPWPYIKYTINF